MDHHGPFLLGGALLQCKCGTWRYPSCIETFMIVVDGHFIRCTHLGMAFNIKCPIYIYNAHSHTHIEICVH